MCVCVYESVLSVCLCISVNDHSTSDLFVYLRRHLSICSYTHLHQSICVCLHLSIGSRLSICCLRLSDYLHLLSIIYLRLSATASVSI